MQNLKLRHIFLLVLAPLQFITSRMHEITGQGRSVGDMSTDAPLLATPAGYAFFIWILIFALQTIYAGWQARPSQRGLALHARIGWPLVMALAASNLWMLTAIYFGNGLTLLVLISIMAVGVFTALVRTVASLTADIPSTAATQRLVLPMLGICAGWLTLAAFLNLAGVLQLLAGLPTGTSLGGIAILLAAFILAGCMFMVLRPSPVAVQSYGCALVWGLLAVTLANAIPAMSPIGVGSTGVAITAWLGALVTVMAMAALVSRR
ncbi:MAG: hypothetical protein EON60_06340 [Alphaproteobacteria bacterium]|nr:MAG: hypothetical protein EON60_06340 [Alphaproteobacteria bacterium]